MVFKWIKKKIKSLTKFFKVVKIKIKSWMDIIIISSLFIAIILIFIEYSKKQKINFEEAKMTIEWIQFNTNGILVILGAMATIISVIISIKHNEKMRNAIELNKAKKDLCILERKLSIFFNYIENDLSCLDKRLVNIYGGKKELYKLNNFSLEKYIVEDIVLLTVSSEILFENYKDKKERLKELRNDVIEILELERKATIKGKWDRYILKDKLEIYDKYLNDEYRSFINKLFEKRLKFDDNKLNFEKEELLKESDSFKYFEKGISMLTKLDEINFSFIKEIDG